MTISSAWKRYAPITIAAISVVAAIIKLIKEYEEYILDDTEYDDSD